MLAKQQRSWPIAIAKTLHPAIFADDCSGYFQYTISGTGADYVAAYAAGEGLMGGKALHLATKTTTPAIDDLVQIRKGLWIPPQLRARLQLLISNRDLTYDNYTNIALQYYDGSFMRKAHIEIQTLNNLIGYYNSVGDWVTLSNFKFNHTFKHWNYFDLSVNLSNNTYHSFVLNDSVTDLSLIPVISTANTTYRRLELVIFVQTKENDIAKMSFDQILITPELR